MGRCSFRFRPRFYTFVPTHNDVDPIANNEYQCLPHYCPISQDNSQPNVPSTGPGPNPQGNLATNSLHGFVLSAIDCNNTSGNCYAVPRGYAVDLCGRLAMKSGPATGASNPHWVTRYENGAYQNEPGTATAGFIDGERRLGASALDSLGVAGEVNGASDLWTGLAGVAVVSGQHWRQIPSGADLSYDPGGTTHDPGPVAGGLTIFPIPITDTHTAATIAREIPVPMGMRVHGVTFFHDTSGAGNGLRLQVRDAASVTTNITPVVSMVSATNETAEVLPVDGDAQFAATATRTLVKGDTLVLLKSGANAMTSFGAFLVCTPKEHFHSEFRRDVDQVVIPTQALQLSNNNPQSWSLHSAVSGPATGGIAYIPLGQFNAPISSVDTVQLQMPMPFDCDILGFDCSNRVLQTGADSHRVSLLNDTTSTTIVSLDEGYYYGAQYYPYSGGWSFADWNGVGESLPVITRPNALVTRGDVLEVRVTTDGGDTFDRAQAGVWVRVTGFPAHGAELD